MLFNTIKNDLDPLCCYAICSNSEVPIYATVLYTYNDKSIVVMSYDDAVIYKLSNSGVYTYSQFLDYMSSICKHYASTADKHYVYELVLLLRDWHWD